MEYTATYKGEDRLMHYGVKGMKWGKRKGRPETVNIANNPKWHDAYAGGYVIGSSDRKYNGPNGQTAYVYNRGHDVRISGTGVRRNSRGQKYFTYREVDTGKMRKNIKGMFSKPTTLRGRAQRAVANGRRRVGRFLRNLTGR